MAVLRDGDPLREMLNTFALDHVGDEVPAECLIVSLASRSVENTNGLHVSVSGESGKGKSDTFNKILLQVPERFRLEGAMSNKALFYIDDMKPGTAIVFDDKSLSEEMQEILKGATSSFRKPIKYRTVSQDRKPQVCTIPERCIWWVAKVEGSGDDQVFNRMLTCWIDDSPEQDAAVLDDMAKKEGLVPERLNATRPGLLTCQAMWEIIGRERIHVVIPFADRILFQTKTNRRNPEMFYSLIKAHTMLFFMQRERCTIDGGGSYTLATLDDFYAAARLFTLLNGTGGGQETKLTRCESELLTAVNQGKDCEFTIQQLQEKLNRSYNAIYSTLHGNRSRDKTYSGLLDKCPAVSFTDRTVVMDEEIGRSVRRRTHAYQFNYELYRLWSSGGQVWLRGTDNDDRTGPSGTTEHNGRITETAQIKNSHETTTETGILTCTNKKYNHSTTNNGNHRHRASPSCARDGPSSSHCEIRISGSEISVPSSSPPIPGPAPEIARNPLDTGPPEPPDTQLLRVKNYKVLERPDYRGHCHLCGRKGVHFTGKVTGKRKARESRSPRRICRSCYQAAVRNEQALVPLLPGIMNTGRMQPATKQLGKCSLCHLDVATWTDPGSSARLCDYCHDRVVREETARNVATGEGSS
jgi:hypothetical protein